MRILLLSALYPPYAFGGAEDCARSFAEWAAASGHQIHVLMAAREPHEGGTVHTGNGVTVEMLATPHIYPVSMFDKAPAWQKPIWHAQDHLAEGTAQAIAARVRAFAPDVVLSHYIQGFGYRTIEHLARCAVPTVFVLHDLGLACMRMSMFRNGQDCETRCTGCRISGALKNRLVEGLAAAAPVGFISPSQAMLDTLDRFMPVKRHAHARILNTKAYPRSARAHVPGDTLRLLYAGKLDGPKGISVLVEAVDRLASERAISLTVAGTGPLRDELLERYGKAPWLRFLGFVSQQVLADEMAVADLLCVPSLWQENSPGVVIQALSNGLPVAATDRGGLAELVEDGRNGLLLRRHNVDDWCERLTAVSDAPGALAGLRLQTASDRARFEQDAIGRETIAFLTSVVAAGPRDRPVAAKL